MKEKKTALSPEGEVLDRLRMFEESLRELLRLSESGSGSRPVLSRRGTEYIYTTLTEDVCRRCPKYRECFGVNKEKNVSRDRGDPGAGVKGKPGGRPDGVRDISETVCLFSALYGGNDVAVPDALSEPLLGTAARRTPAGNEKTAGIPVHAHAGVQTPSVRRDGGDGAEKAPAHTFASSPWFPAAFRPGIYR